MSDERAVSDGVLALSRDQNFTQRSRIFLREAVRVPGRPMRKPLLAIVSHTSRIRSKPIIFGACTAAVIFAGCGPQPLDDGFPDAGGTSGAAARSGAGGTTSTAGNGGSASVGGSTGTGGSTAAGGHVGAGGSVNTGGSMSTGGSTSTGGAAATGGASGTSAMFGGAGRAGSVSGGGNAGTAFGAGGTGFGTGGAKPFGGSAGTGTSMTFGGGGRAGAPGGAGGKGAGGMTGSGGASSFTAVAAIFQAQCGKSSCHGGRQNPNLSSSNLTTLYSNLTNTAVRQCGSDHLVTKNDPANSAVLELAQHQCGSFVMPDGCTSNPCLSAADMTTLTNWITAGAPGP